MDNDYQNTHQLNPIQTEPIPKVNQVQTHEVASFLDRVKAFLLDFFIFVPPIIYLILLRVFLYTNKSDININFLLNLAPFYFPLYNLIALVIFRTTLGKRLIKIKITSSSGEEPTITQIILRETIGKMISGSFLSLGYLWALWDPNKQTWHDKIAGTLVIKDISVVSRKKEVLIYLGIIIFYIILPIIFILFFSRSIYVNYKKYQEPCLNTYTSIAEAMSDRANVCGLYLESQNLTSVPSELQYFPNLHTLSLAKNNFNSFPLDVLQLKGITQLDLSENNLGTIPPQISELENLSDIHLRKTNISALPMELTKLPHLNYLNLSGNNFTTIPPVIEIIRKNGNNIAVDLTDNPL